MLRRVVIATSILCLTLPAAGLAQGFSQGDKVATLSGTGLSDNEFADNDFAVSGSLSYFLSDAWELGVRQELSMNNASGGDDDWAASTIVALDYNFDLGRWWPLIGVNFGYIYGDAVSDTWVAGPEAGVRYFVNDTTFILGMISYEIFFDDADEADDAFDDGEFIYTLGIGFRW